ncbi:BnaA01g27020D [Brassica napus]|uniref:BnaA01g27020D protein n=2 Tax=Brassica napus TaxID=3708 RepID=A0A078G1L2_BRANA|nr:BnaA01g27020D [Brassica napus]
MPRTCLDSQTRNSPQVMDLFKPRHTDPEKLIYKAMFKWVLEMSSTRAATTVVLRQHYRKPQPCEEGVLFCFNNMP